MALRVPAPEGIDVRLLRVDPSDAEGLSGAALGADGDVWVVAERQRRLLRMRETGDALQMQGAAIALDGLADGLETESLAWLGDHRFLLGTETGDARDRDLLLLMTVEGSRASITRRITVDYAALGVRVDDNHGIEGACAVGQRVVLALEARREDGTANVLLHDLASGQWQTRQLRLTTHRPASSRAWIAAAVRAMA